MSSAAAVYLHIEAMIGGFFKKIKQGNSKKLKEMGDNRKMRIEIAGRLLLLILVRLSPSLRLVK